MRTTLAESIMVGSFHLEVQPRKVADPVAIDQMPRKE
jgi:hypothetical protein